MNSIPILTVLRPGLMSTVQDLGRTGLRGIAIATGGAMDAYSLRVANALAGNRPTHAALEVTLLGPTLRAEADIVCAVAGADVAVTVDSMVIAHGSAFALRTGQTISFGRPHRGVRAYLAVAGGFDVPVVLGSRSTFVRAAIGGIEGRALRAGDVLNGRTALSGDYFRLGWTKLRGGDEPTDQAIRVVFGPHAGLFDEAEVEHFLASEYTVSHESDRMGIRLNGPPLSVATIDEMVSEPVPLGAIQVPPNGTPIVLMADQQTTGGYPMIAVVIAADFAALAQRPPGVAVRFAAVSLAAAHEAWRVQQQELATMEAGARFRAAR